MRYINTKIVCIHFKAKVKIKENIGISIKLKIIISSLISFIYKIY